MLLPVEMNSPRCVHHGMSLMSECSDCEPWQPPVLQRVVVKSCSGMSDHSVMSRLTMWLESLHQRLAAIFLALIEKDYVPDFLLRCEHSRMTRPPPPPRYVEIFKGSMSSCLALQMGMPLPHCEDAL